MNGLEKFAWFDFVKNSWKEVGTAGPYIHTIDTICMRSLLLNSNLVLGPRQVIQPKTNEKMLENSSKEGRKLEKLKKI
ncbi:hypothetical protein ACFX13_029099 [Malus domestica]